MEKFLFLLVASLGLTSISATPKLVPKIFEDIINQTIEDYRSTVEDPQIIDELFLEPPSSLSGILDGSLRVSNFKSVGQKGFQIPFLEGLLVGGFGVNLTFFLPQIDSLCDFDSNLTFFDTLRLTGVGTWEINLKDINIDFLTRITTEEEVVQLFDTKILLTVGNILKINYTGLELGGRDISVGFSSLVKGLEDYINDKPEEFSEFVSPIFESFVNKILKGQSVSAENLKEKIGEILKPKFSKSQVRKVASLEAKIKSKIL